MNVIAVVAAGASLAGALITVVLGAVFERRRQRAERTQARLDLAERYSQPLLAAASALASRLGNADARQVEEFTTADGARGARYLDYLRYETLYRIGRYLCWVHLIARELRVMDLGNEQRNRELVRRLGAVQHAISDRTGDLTFMLLGGEQWALGELMVDPDSPDGDPRCISYIAFRERMTDPSFARWFIGLRADVDSLAADLPRALPRIRRIRAALHDLIQLLDPHRLWEPFDETEPAG